MCATVVTTGGRAGRRLHRTLPGHHLHSGVDVIHHLKCRESRPGTTSHRRATLERTETVVPRPARAEHDQRSGPSRSIPHDDRSLMVSTPSTHRWRHASRDRTHRSARDWQRYVVGKVLLSSETAQDPGAGAGGVAIIKIVGARAGELAACSTVERGGRLKSARYANHRLQPPAMRVRSRRGWGNTKCVRDCVRWLDGSRELAAGCVAVKGHQDLNAGGHEN